MEALPTLTSVTMATLAGGPGPNQDHAVVTEHAAAVLDGATSWLRQPPGRDGGLYARALGAALTPLLDDDTRPAAELVADAIAQLRDRFDLVPGDSPSCTVTIARWAPSTIEVYTLGDSPAVVQPLDDDPVPVYDERLESVAPATDAAAHGVTARFDTDRFEALMLMSDGVSGAVMQYRLHDWAGLRAAFEAGPAELLHAVHEAERDDADGVRWPRSKRHDDKTAVLVRRRR